MLIISLLLRSVLIIFMETYYLFSASNSIPEDKLNFSEK